MSGGCTILLLDDEPLILMDLEFAAEDRDCHALCATSVAEALAFIDASAEDIDVAVLDVTLKQDETCVPVAQRLDELGIPYLLHSGDLNRRNELVSELGVRHIPKPADSHFVIDTAMGYLESDAESEAS